MSVEFTQDQLKAIETRGCDLLVSAAAGSGKTAVLVERIVRLVCDEARPVDIDRLLVVTFTRAAAAEMRERVCKRIEEELQKYPDSAHIQRQYSLVHRARITTIDAFCQSIVREHFHELGLDPEFRIMDEGEKKLLEQEVLGRVLEECYAEKDPGFFECVEWFCSGGSDERLAGIVLSLSGYAESFPWPEDFLLERKKDHDLADMDAFWASEAVCEAENNIRLMLAGYRDAYGVLRKICEEPDGPYMYAETVEAEEEGVSALAEKSMKDLSSALPAFAASFQTLSSRKDPAVNPEKRELAKGIRGKLKDGIRALSDAYFTVSPEIAFERIRGCKTTMDALIDLTIRYRMALRAEKRERKMLDFSDLEHYALELLSDPSSDAAKEYRDFFAEIIIDEYQDSNAVQECILETVSGESEGLYNRFMVGDVKQSIYAFRQARPDLFLEKQETYQETGEHRKHFLSANFRSRREVTDSVNAVFERIMSKETGGIDYDEHARLNPKATYPEGSGFETELLVFDNALFAEVEEAENVQEAEALVIAGKIRELMGSLLVTEGKKEEAHLRPLQYKDIVILHRSAGTVNKAFLKIFDAHGIPLHTVQQTGYFEANEVQDALNVLRAISNPRKDIPLYGMLTGPFGGFTEEDVAKMRAGRKGKCLLESVREAAEEDERARAFLERLSGYRKQSTYTSVREMLESVFDEHHYLEYVSALPGGSGRLANVEMLLKRAADFEKTNPLGLSHFIRYMDQLDKYETDFGEADTLDENADVVRLMTIHKSKGLEFPVVFLAGMGKEFNLSDASDPVICDRKLGIACSHINTQLRTGSSTLRRSVIASRIRLEQIAEEMRLFYVALTRAKEKLIMTGARKDAEKELAKPGAERLGFREYASSKCLFDFLLPVLSATGIRTTLADAPQLQTDAEKEDRTSAERMSRVTNAASYADEALLLRLREGFSWQYPYGYLEKVYTKTTVSELKMAAMADRDEGAYHEMEGKNTDPVVPSFLSEEEAPQVTGTVRGNAYHRCMEILDFDRCLGSVLGGLPESYERYAALLAEKKEALTESLNTFLKEETESLRLPSEYAKALNLSKLEAFLGTALAFRMWQAKRRGELFREQPFVYGIPAGRLLEPGREPGGALDEEILLIQGIIDAYFVEDGQIVLLDYKTDRVDSMEELFRRYETQLDHYREALEKLTGLPVKEKGLYSFSLGAWETI